MSSSLPEPKKLMPVHEHYRYKAMQIRTYL